MKNKFVKISLLCIAIILMGLTLYQIATYEVINISAKEANLKALNPNPGTIISGADPDSYTYYLAPAGKYSKYFRYGEDPKENIIMVVRGGSSEEGAPKDQNNWIPQIVRNAQGDYYQMYCIEPSSHLYYYNYGEDGCTDLTEDGKEIPYPYDADNKDNLDKYHAGKRSPFKGIDVYTKVF